MPYRLVDPAGSPRLRAALHVVAGAATAILLIGVLGLLVQTASLSALIRDTQVANTQRTEVTRNAAQAAERGTDRIEDCTTPGRECFEEGQSRLAEAITGINDYATYAAACADKPRQQTYEEIKACILEQITAAKLHRRDR